MPFPIIQWQPHNELLGTDCYSTQYGLDGRWLVEGYGVAPDIEVENLPHESYLGKDAQLEAAIAYLRDKLASDPIPDLVPGPIPPVGEPGRDVK